MVKIHLKNDWDFPGGSGVENWPCNAGDVRSIPSGGIKIPQAMGQLSGALFNYRAQVLWMPHATTRGLGTATTAPARRNEEPVPQPRLDTVK